MSNMVDTLVTRARTVYSLRLDAAKMDNAQLAATIQDDAGHLSSVGIHCSELDIAKAQEVFINISVPSMRA